MKKSIFFGLAAILALAVAAQHSFAGPPKRSSIQVLVGCTLDGDLLTVNLSAELKEGEQLDPNILSEVVTLQKRVGPTLTDVEPKLYDTLAPAGVTVNSIQNTEPYTQDPLVLYGDLPISFTVDLCADTPELLPDLSGAKALGVKGEITIDNASIGGVTGVKTFNATCKVLGLPSCAQQ